jgi:hypothetical protein
MQLRVYPAFGSVRPSVTFEGWMQPGVHLPEGRLPFPALDRTTVHVEGILRVFADGPPPLSPSPINLGTIPPPAEGDGDTPS